MAKQIEKVAVFSMNKVIRLDDGSMKDAGNWPVARTLAGSHVAFREFIKNKLDEMASAGVLDDYNVIIGQATFQLEKPDGTFVANWAITFNEVPFKNIQPWLDEYSLPARLSNEYNIKEHGIADMEQWLRENGSDDRGPACAVYDKLGYYLGLDPRIKTHSEWEQYKRGLLLYPDKSNEDLIKDLQYDCQGGILAIKELLHLRGVTIPEKPLHYQLATYDCMYPERTTYEEKWFHSQKDAEDYWQSFCEKKMVEAARSSSAYSIQKLSHELEVRRNGQDALVYSLVQL